MLLSLPCDRLKMLPVTPSPTLLQFHESPCWVTHSKTGGGGHSSLNKERAQGLGCMLFGASDRGKSIGSPEHLKCKAD